MLISTCNKHPGKHLFVEANVGFTYSGTHFFLTLAKKPTLAKKLRLSVLVRTASVMPQSVFELK